MIEEPPVEQRPRYDEEIRLIAGIVERADRTVRPNAALLVFGGAIGAAIDLCYYVYYWRYYVLGPKYAPGVALSVAHAAGIALILGAILMLLIRRPSSRWTTVDRQLATTFGVAPGLAWLITKLGYPTWVMVGPDYSILWNALLAVPMLSIGFQYINRTLILGGFALAASLVVARFDLWNIELYLAIGMVAGLVVPGIVFGLQRRRG